MTKTFQMRYEIVQLFVIWDPTCLTAVLTIRHLQCFDNTGKGKAVPLQAWTGPEGSSKLRFPDFVTTAQDGGRLSALRTGRF